jgi:hypothetical protein
VNLTSHGLHSLFLTSPNLTNLNLSNLSHAVTDKLISHLTISCPKIQSLSTSRCVSLTDLSICSIGSNLWIEEIDVSFCNKLTDTGLEVLALTCTGLRSVWCQRLNKITNKALHLLLKNCKQLREIHIESCERIEIEKLREFLRADEIMKQVRVYHRQE